MKSPGVLRVNDFETCLEKSTQEHTDAFMKYSIKIKAFNGPLTREQANQQKLWKVILILVLRLHNKKIDDFHGSKESSS